MWDPVTLQNLQFSQPNSCFQQTFSPEDDDGGDGVVTNGHHNGVVGGGGGNDGV